MKALSVLAAALILLSCAGHSVAPQPNPQGDVRVRILDRDLRWLNDTTMLMRFNPPYIYGQWRLQMEACSGKTRNGWPTFYVAPITPLAYTPPTPSHPQGEPIGGWYAGGNIVFSLGYEVWEPAVKHELLHWLIESEIPPKPSPRETYEEFSARVHPEKYFQDLCGGALSHG